MLYLMKNFKADFTYNKANPPLSDEGVQFGKRFKLRNNKFEFDMCYTSYLLKDFGSALIFVGDKIIVERSHALDNAKNEFHSVISRRGIEANYRSIVQVKEDRILNYGYFVNFKVKSNVFKNIEMLKKAGKQFNQCKGILSLCMKECVPPYYNARENYFSKLIIPINYDELDATLDQATRITHLNESHIVFLLDINEFLDIEDLNIAYQTINKVQLKGYEVGLLIREGEFQVKKELYEAIDMFFVDCELEENVKADSKSFINAHALLEKLVSYKKPIIEINARSFSEIELIYRSGIQYFSSDIIQSFSPMITPLDKKTIKKLVNIAK